MRREAPARALNISGDLHKGMNLTHHDHGVLLSDVHWLDAGADLAWPERASAVTFRDTNLTVALMNKR